MKITFPHMGNTYISAGALLRQLGLEVIVPPFSSSESIKLGRSYAPEFACLPFMINMGNIIEACQMGADTVLMAGGCGPCRFGYYGDLEREILKDAGYDYRLMVIQPPKKNILQLLSNILRLTGSSSCHQIVKAARFAWSKAKMADQAEIMAQQMRPRVIKPGEADIWYSYSLSLIDQAANLQELDEVQQQIMKNARMLELDNNKQVIKIGLIGEIYTMLEPAANHYIEQLLGRLEVEVSRSLYLSHWINDHLLCGLVKDIPSNKDVFPAAYPYLGHFIGGHALETIGCAAEFSFKNKVDGLIQIYPFSCMPEIVAQSILPTVAKDNNIPLMTLIVDEQYGEAGMLTRLEAFVDLLAARKYAAVSA